MIASLRSRSRVIAQNWRFFPESSTRYERDGGCNPRLGARFVLWEIARGCCRYPGNAALRGGGNSSCGVCHVIASLREHDAELGAENHGGARRYQRDQREQKTVLDQ